MRAGGAPVLIAEKIYQTDPDTLFLLVVIYQLREIGRMFFPENIVNDDRSIEKLMTPSCYTGYTERRQGAITQPHRLIIK